MSNTKGPNAEWYRQNIIDNEALEWFGFERLHEGDEEWRHRWLEPRNLFLYYFDQSYHFVIRQNTAQGIGSMRTIDELANGFKFVTSHFNGQQIQYMDLYNLPS